MARRIGVFPQLEIETATRCNRTCPNCPRQCYPGDRSKLEPWLTGAAQMPDATVLRLLEEGAALGCRRVCLQHWNEPLYDSRIGSFGRFAKRCGFEQVFVCTNADLITPDLARELDGSLTGLWVALYMPKERHSEREAYLRSLFSKTDLGFSGGYHYPPHTWEQPDYTSPCKDPGERLVINHHGDMLLCCDDGLGHFDLGNVHKQSLDDLWWSERHQDLVIGLREGRREHWYCQVCPRFRV